MADRGRVSSAAGRGLVQVVLLTVTIFAVAGLSLTWLVAEGRAQHGGSIEVIKSLAGSQTVRVGEVVTFHITIRNTTAFSFTTIPLTDVFRADLLSQAPAYIGPPADSLTYVGSSGVLSWTNMAAQFGGFILPGQVVTVTLAFTAEHPTGRLTVVNRAGVHDAVNINGESGFEGSGEAENRTVGGATPVTKTLEPLGGPPLVGLPVTFTINVRNNGAATLYRLPLEDTYDPVVLAFNYAVPPPSQVITPTGAIRWADLTTYFGPIPADTTITVTVVFTLVNLSGARVNVNQAQVAGAQDEYQNTLAPGRDQVPLRILLPSTPTPTPTPRQRDHEQQPTPTWTPAPTSTPTTVTATAVTTTTFPSLLPETGAPPGGWPLIASGLLLILGGSALLNQLK